MGAKGEHFYLWFDILMLVLIVILMVGSILLRPIIFEEEKSSEKTPIVLNFEEQKKEDLLPIILRLQPKLDPTLARTISDNILLYSKEYSLPPKLVIHIINRESNFSPLARSKAGAIGLMQIMVKAHKDKLEKLGITPQQAYHIDNNIRLGCWIFRDYFNTTKDVRKTLTKYVGGNHEEYIKDILTGFTNEEILGVENGKSVSEENKEIGERERNVETQTESE